jgi:very-short-patch-repair endonuclease
MAVYNRLFEAWRSGGYGGYGGSGYGGFRRRGKYSDPSKYQKAIEMRNNPTEAEARMWVLLRNQVYNYFPNNIFYRQSVNYGYILDFYCPSLKLGLEVDGSIHDQQQEYDYYRDLNLARQGIKIFRFSNDDVLYHPKQVETSLYQVITQRSTEVKKSGCFIATAAFKTPMAKEINVLRIFRDLWMEHNSMGRYMIRLYYGISPSIACIVSRNTTLKSLVQLSLKPLICFLRKKIIS